MIVNLSDRKKEVLRILSEDWGSSVSQISNRLGVSTVTIRSDLEALAEEGYIIRTRGGAMPAYHTSIYDRLKSMAQEKGRIASAAAELIADGEHVMVVAGTTTAATGRYLLGKRDVHVVTNSTLLLPYARVNPTLHLTLVGGQFRSSAEAMVGPIAIRELEQFHVNKAFVGTDGFSVERGITADLVEVSEVVRKMMEQADESILLADSSKYGRSGFAHISSLDNISRVITDDGLGRRAVEKLEEEGIEVTVV